MKQRHRGLGKLQIMQRQETEDRILNHLIALGKIPTSTLDGTILETKWAYVRSIQRATGINPNSLIKAINRMVSEKNIMEFKGKNNSRLFCLPNSVNSKSMINRIKSRYKPDLAAARYQKKIKKREKRNRFTWYPNHQVLNSIIDIEYKGKNEKEILDQLGISKRGYESRIKRSPRLSFIRKKLQEYKREGKQLPEFWYESISPLMAKRLLVNPEKLDYRWR
ncbi:MAG: hypothetical protein ACREA3_04800 [Nitrosotalea sp.]